MTPKNMDSPNGAGFFKMVMMIYHGTPFLRKKSPTTLPETNSKFAPKNGWLEYDPFLLGFGLFSGANLLLVSGRVNKSKIPIEAQ